MSVAPEKMYSVSRHDSAERVLEGLDPEQREVAQTLLGPVCVLAGAGTGKTRAVTHRIAYGVRTGTYNPSSVLALTFTTRAAGELRERLGRLGAIGVQARTFHSAALRQLRYFLPRVEQRQVPRIIESKAQMVATAARRLGMEVDKAAVRDLAAEIEWAKVNLWTPQDYQDKAPAAGRGEAAGYQAVAVSRLMRTYEEAWAEAQVMDFEDVLLILAGLMMVHPAVTTEIRSRYRHFVVDEYQDVSPLQQRLLDLWLGERQELCVVGDPAQTIYSFAGANSSFLTDFIGRYPAAMTVRLVRDYRSTPQVVELANRVVRKATSRGGLELVAQKAPGPPVTYTRYGDDAAEAAGTVARIKVLLDKGVAAEQIAVLYRTNAQSEPFEAALSDAGIGYTQRGGERFFDRQEVRQALMLLRAEAKTDSDLSPLERVEQALRAGGWAPEPPGERGAVRERWESLDALAALAHDLLAPGEATLPDLVQLLEQRSQVGFAPTGSGVQLATLHAAKGLEWEAVFLAGLSNGLVPISLAERAESIEEERRLLYVGITRAKTHLELSYAAARLVGGAANRRHSRFLNGIWPAPERRKKTKAPTPGLDELTDSERELFERLRLWRLEVAQRAALPAFVVLTDVTLRALAAGRPTTPAGLATIPGIGPTKLDLYGPDLLALLGGPNPG
jgi:DNA helicase-2/ATP-dependent DNA helicase PcrA